MILTDYVLPAARWLLALAIVAWGTWYFIRNTR